MVQKRLMVGAATVAALLLAAFFAFVGWHKAFSPLSELRQHKVWTLSLPEWLGRAVGWSEMILALGLLMFLTAVPRAIGRVCGLALIANQCAAAAVHMWRGETAALPQNAMLVGLLLLVFLIHGRIGERG